MYRPEKGRRCVGVCAGLAVHLGVSVTVVRLLFFAVSLLFSLPLGVAVYLMLWVFTPVGYHVDPETGRIQVGGDSFWVRLLRRESPWPVVVTAAILLMVGVPWAAAIVGPKLSLPVVASLLTVAGGAAIAWSHLDEEDRQYWMGISGGHRWGVVRVVCGAAVAVAGMVVLVLHGSDSQVLWSVCIAVAAVLAGLAVVLTPWAIRLRRRLQTEQAARIRETERADIAAHLHDSVLQTLALIQRSDDLSRAAQLARVQERELRQWLYAGGRAATDSLSTMVGDVVSEVEELHGVPVELVTIGDRELDEPTEAAVRALREALLNAVRHGAAPVTAYVEVGRTGLEIFVRDRGEGFDLDAVPTDRLGVRESILGRMERAGGSARIRRLESGTEVELTLPFSSSSSAEAAGGSLGEAVV